MSFRLPLSNIIKENASTAKDMISNAPRKAIKELFILDLIFEEGKPTIPSHGIYIFFSNSGICLYVGRNKSRDFIERIASHFSLQENAYMNTILQKTKENYNIEYNSEAAIKAKDYELLLIPIDDYLLMNIQLIEDFFRVILEPIFNPPSKAARNRYDNYDPSRPLDELLGINST
jgi:hypothetical protein